MSDAPRGDLHWSLDLHYKRSRGDPALSAALKKAQLRRAAQERPQLVRDLRDWCEAALRGVEGVERLD